MNEEIKKIAVRVKHCGTGYYSHLWLATMTITLRDETFWRIRAYATTNDLDYALSRQKKIVRYAAFERLDVERYVSDNDYRERCVNAVNAANREIHKNFVSLRDDIFGVIGFNFATYAIAD